MTVKPGVILHQNFRGPGLEIVKFVYPPCSQRPRKQVPCRNFGKMFNIGKSTIHGEEKPKGLFTLYERCSTAPYGYTF